MVFLSVLERAGFSCRISQFYEKHLYSIDMDLKQQQGNKDIFFSFKHHILVFGMQDTKAQRQMGYYRGEETLNNGYKRCTEASQLYLTVVTV